MVVEAEVVVSVATFPLPPLPPLPPVLLELLPPGPHSFNSPPVLLFPLSCGPDAIAIKMKQNTNTEMRL
nr:hypothetical protein HmN_000034400 [Hymenolepis microstoma]